MRKSGVLLHISSLPSPYGIGSFGAAAYKFADWLCAARQSSWQILPLVQPGSGDSPYQSFSSFAGNPYFIDLDLLIGERLLTKSECAPYKWVKDAKKADYPKLLKSRAKLLALACGRFTPDGGFAAFAEENAFWLDDYALFMAIKESKGGAGLDKWEDAIRLKQPRAVAAYTKALGGGITYHKYVQYLFFKQWAALKAYVNAAGIEIIGDLPIYVSSDSADFWSHPELFTVDSDRRMTFVAGCPPDYFAKTGQLWGNPLYNWDEHKKSGYGWWTARLEHCFKLYDTVRIDHFRGFDEYYSIPADAATAQKGEWLPGPGKEFFAHMKAALGQKKIIAEDLGTLTPSVIALRRAAGYPGMKIMQFAFSARSKGDSEYLPHNHVKNCVVYTGTHDNQTLVSWYRDLRRADRVFLRRYLSLGRGGGHSFEIIRASFASVADTVIIPMQDYLELDDDARMNTPSTVGDNWRWRMTAEDMSESLAETLCELSKTYGRNKSAGRVRGKERVK